MILSSDLHLRRTMPRSRVDDYWSAQERKFRFILEQAQASPPLLVAGDFFHQPRPGEALLQWVISLLRKYDVTPIMVPGQHDLPGHSLEQVSDSGLGVLAAAGVIDLLYDKGPEAMEDGLIIPFNQVNQDIIIYGFSYGQEPWLVDKDKNWIHILLWHKMVVKDNDLWPGQGADKAPALLKKYPQFDLIVTGDNHQTFCTSSSSFALPDREGKIKPRRYLVNPGSMMRMTAAQVDHQPCIFKWEPGKAEQIFLPTEPNVLDLTQLEQAKEKDSRIQAFVEQLDGTVEMGLSFEKNLEEFLNKNEVDPETRDLAWRYLE